MSWYDPTTWNDPTDWIGEQWDDLTGATQAQDAAEQVGTAAAEDRAYSHPNVNGPLGSQTITRDPVTGEVTVNTALSGPQQGLVDSLYSDLGTGRQRVEDALYQRATSRLDPQWQDTESSRRTQLYNQGLTEGDAAFDREMRNLGNQRTDAYEAARNASIAAGGQEQSRLISALMAAANPGLRSYYGENNAADTAIAQQNLLAGVPTGLESIIAIISALGSK